MKAPKPPLSFAQLAQVARAALDNAGELLSDARLLLDAGRWPRAYALAVPSAEEFGKFYSRVVAGTYAPDDAKAWKEFWNDFTRHPPKFTAWASEFVDSLDWGPVGSEDDAEWKRAWDSRGEVVKTGLAGKMAALYVDFEDGQVRVPDALFSEKTTRTTVAIVARVVERVLGNRVAT